MGLREKKIFNPSCISHKVTENSLRAALNQTSQVKALRQFL